MEPIQLETEIFNIISHGGNAKALAYEALEAAHKTDFEKADEILKEAHQEMNHAHKTQTRLIQAEINGEKFEKSLLMIHAQDHLMTAMSEMSLIEQMIRLIKKIEDLQK